VLTTSAPSITEGDAGTKALTFTLTLSEAPTMDVVVNYQTLTSGTASSGDDFVAAAGTVTFAVGQRTAAVSVNVLGDTAVEANETVQVEFSGSRLVSSVTATGTITNDDTANAPVGAVSDSNTATNTVAENAVVGTVVGITASATDATAGETVAYALTTNPGNLFAIDAVTGVVTVAGTLDYETATSHSITVAAISSDGSTSNASFTVAVTDVAEGQTFVLTTGVDTGAAFTGGTGDDTFNAGLDGIVPTLGNLDSLNGGAGTDTLNVELLGVTAMPAALTSIEQVNVTSLGASDLDLRNAASVATITSIGSTAGLTLSNIQSAATIVTIANTTAAHEVDYAAAAVGGSADVAYVAVVNMTGDADLVVDSAVETLVLASTGTNDIDIDFQDEITIIGSGSLNITGTLGGVAATLVDASTYSGSLSINADNHSHTIMGGSGADFISGATGIGNNLSGNGGEDTLFGGTGDDTISGGADNDYIAGYAGDDILVGGAGNDTFDMSNLGDLAAAGDDTVAGDEGTDTLATTTADALAYTTPATRTISGIEHLRLSTDFDGAAGGSTLTLANIDTAINELSLRTGSTAAADDTIVGGAGTLTINLIGALSDTFTVNDTGTATTDVLNIVNAAAQTNIGGTQSIVIGGYETVNINASGSVDAADLIFNAITLAADTGGTSTLNFTGSNSVTVQGVITAGVINASAMTGSLVMNVAAASVTSITGGSAGDALRGDASSTISGGAGDDLIDGGLGNDVLNGDAGDDAITGGGGNDILAGGDGDDTLTGNANNDSVFGGNGDDTIDVAAGNDSVDAGVGNDTITAGAGTDNITAGDGDDRVVMANQLSAVDVVSGGAGNDTLVISGSVAAADASQTTGFEVIELDTAGTQSLYNFATGNSITTAVIANNGTNTFSDAAAGTNSLVLASSTAGSITFGRLFDTAADSLTITREAGVAGASLIGALSVDNEETVTIDTTTTTGNFNTTGLVASDLTSLTITGSGVVGIVTAAGLGTTDRTITVNASSSTGTVTFNASGNVDTGVALSFTGASTVANTVTGGAGADTLTGGSAADSLTGGIGNDQITGGGGADALVGGDGNDSLTGGEGGDVFTGGGGLDTITMTETTAARDFVWVGLVSNGESTVSNMDVITGFDTGTAATDDALDFGAVKLDVFTSSNGEAISAGGQFTWNDNLQSVGAVVSLLEQFVQDNQGDNNIFLGVPTLDADDGVFFFEFGGDTYVGEIAGSGGFVDAGSEVVVDLVKLVGITGMTTLTDVGGNIFTLSA
jgi:Ca2+-binding RTX toxin-like protein